jgi:uncharacterized membrane protein
MLYARARIGPTTGYWFGGAFLMYPTVQFIGLYDFGLLQLSIPSLAWAFYMWISQRRVAFFGFLVLAILCREEVGLVVFALGLYLIGAERAWYSGAVASVLGLAYSTIVILWVMPWFRESGDAFYLTHYEALGGAPADILKNIVTSPRSMIRLLLEPTRIGNLIMFLLPVQFVSLLSPGLLAISLPNVAATFLAGPLSIYSYFLYYLSPSVPFIFFAAIEGARRLSHKIEPSIVGPWIGVGALVTTVMFGPSPISRAFWNQEYRLGSFHSMNFHRSHYVVTEHALMALRVVRMVPNDAIVSAEQPFLPHLFNRRRIYVFPTLTPDVEYVLIDRNHPLKSGFGETFLDFRQRPDYYYAMVEGNPGRWTLIHETDGIRLFRRKRGE